MQETLKRKEEISNSGHPAGKSEKSGQQQTVITELDFSIVACAECFTLICKEPSWGLRLGLSMRAKAGDQDMDKKFLSYYTENY